MLRSCAKDYTLKVLSNYPILMAFFRTPTRAPRLSADQARQQHHRSQLNAQRRADLLQRLQDNSVTENREEIDLIVIGAGVTGAGIALDASLRGLRVVLLDAHDIAFGTSRWSSKLAHGGLRYLAQGNFAIARSSARERGIMLEHTAPHLTQALAQVVPVQDRFSLANRLLPRLGFLAGDLLRSAAGTRSSTLPRSRTIGAAAVRTLCPHVEMSDLRCGFVNYDGQLIDDARLVTALVRTAAAHGAQVVTHCRAHAISPKSSANKNSTSAGFANVVTVEDSLTGKRCDLQARAIVNATGIWASELEKQVTITASRGTHLVVKATSVGSPTGALTIPVPGAVNRFCFILPAQLGRCYIGITDEAHPGAIPDEPATPDSDVDWILDVVNQSLTNKLRRADVIGSFTGLRPLITINNAHAGPTESTEEPIDTAGISRDHAIFSDDSGVMTVTGGKLTEYRLMAQQAVDEVIRVTGMAANQCTTMTTPLFGAPKSATGYGVMAADYAGLPDSLLKRFGSEAPYVVTTSLLDRPLDPVAPGIDVVRAEFSFHVTHEGAMSVSDIVDRRSRIGLVPRDREAAVPCAVEALHAFGIEVE